jgi:hypothetical protein
VSTEHPLREEKKKEKKKKKKKKKRHSLRKILQQPKEYNIKGLFVVRVPHDYPSTQFKVSQNFFIKIMRKRLVKYALYFERIK